MSDAVAKLTIRPTREDDLEPLADALAFPRDRLRWAWDEIRRGERVMLVAEVEGRPVGRVSLIEHPERLGSLQLYALDVAEPYRRRGIGSALSEAVEAEARRRGLPEVHLKVALANREAIRLYRRLGYRQQGEAFTDHWSWTDRKGVQHSQEARSIVMTKPLD